MDQLRVIDTFGPSTIPPVVLSTRLAPDLRRQIKEALLAIHTDPFFAQRLHEGQIERFVPIPDEQYNDIRGMYDRVHADIQSTSAP